MSTLTKILIVLLTVSSIFLCGIVVTYVANADNFREQNKQLTIQLQSAKQNEKASDKQLNENLSKSQQREKKLGETITSLKNESSRLQLDLKNLERERASLEERVSNMAGTIETTSQTAEQQRKLFENTFAELKETKAQQIKDRKQLEETTKTLQERMAIIETLQTEKRRLLEEKADLQQRLDKLILPGGEISAKAKPVTPDKDKAQPARITREIGLEGLVTAVDMKNTMASISIGSADGVRDGMKFHVTRGNKFICDILILEVDAKQSVGILELVQEQPKVEDKVSTNL